MPLRFHRWVATHSLAVILVVLILSLLALIQLFDFKTGTIRLHIDSSLQAISTRSAVEQKIDSQIRLRFGDAQPVLVMMRVADLFQTTHLQQLDRLSRALQKLDGVKSVDSLTATTLPLIVGDELNYSRATPQALQDPALAEPLRRTARNNPLITGQLVSADGKAALILVHLKTQSEQTMLRSQLAQHIRQQADRFSTADIDIFVSGDPLIRSELSRAITQQLQTVIPAILGVIMLLLALVFRNIRGVLIPLATIAIALLWVLALISLLGRSLNLVSALAPPFIITMGLAYSAHVIAEFERLLRHSGKRPATGTAILMLLTLFFTPALLRFTPTGEHVTGDLSSQTLFGWLAALTLFLTWLIDLFVTPAFVSGLRIVTLWDTLRLNLGDRVQQTIPLFEGLTQRQARIFALMANLHSLPAGARLMTEGEDAGDIFIVIDGDLSVFRERGQQRQTLNVMRRGDVIGEQGYFGQRRTASVEATTESRLLRFSEGDQERLCKAYPQIAARVFLNLNRLQAQRYARSSRMADSQKPSPRSLSDLG